MNKDEQPDWERPEGPTFKQELTILINKHGLDTMASTPDYVLAAFFEQTYGALKQAHDTIIVRHEGEL